MEAERLERLELQKKRKEEIQRRERQREQHERRNLQLEEKRQRAIEREIQRIREYEEMERERNALRKLRHIQQQKLSHVLARLVWPRMCAQAFGSWQESTKRDCAASRIQHFWIRFRKRKDESTLQAASALQSAFRGFHVRRKIDAALKLAKVMWRQLYRIEKLSLKV